MTGSLKFIILAGGGYVALRYFKIITPETN